MKRLSFILGLCMVLLSACGGAKATADINYVVIATGIAQTLTALPTGTPPPYPTFTPIPPTATVEIALGTPSEYPPLPTITDTPLATALLPSWTPFYNNIQPTYLPPTATPLPSAQTPAQFISYYFSLINSRKYDVAWSFLTPNFIANNNGPATGGYLGYVNYWNTVASVIVTSVYLQSQVGASADVLVYATYNYFNGTVINTNVHYDLVYDYVRATWLFDSHGITPTYVAPTLTPLPYALTPSQFIYYYFSLINSRQYDIAWTFLTANFIANNNGPATGGYSGYVNYWNTVQSVVVTSVYTQSIVGNTSSVIVYATYNYYNGTVINTNVSYYLIYNTVRATWLFESP